MLPNQNQYENVPKWFSIFCRSNDIFLPKKNDKAFLFYIYFSHLCNISNKRKSGHDMCIWMFSIRRLHFERITWIFVYDGCHNQLLDKIVSNLILWIVDCWQSHLGLGAHLKGWQRKRNVKRWTSWGEFQGEGSVLGIASCCKNTGGGPIKWLLPN